MIYVGQSLLLTPYSNDAESIPVILLGESKDNDKLMLDANDVVHEFQDNLDEIALVFMKDTDSPTGKRVYYGNFCTYTMLPPGMRMKAPQKEALDKEFRVLKKLNTKPSK